MTSSGTASGIATLPPRPRNEALGRADTKIVGGVAADSGGGVSFQTVASELFCCSAAVSAHAAHSHAAAAAAADDTAANANLNTNPNTNLKGMGVDSCTSATVAGYTYTMPEGMLQFGTYDDDDGRGYGNSNSNSNNASAGGGDDDGEYGIAGPPELPEVHPADSLLRFAAVLRPACLLFEFTFTDPTTQQPVADLVKYLGGPAHLILAKVNGRKLSGGTGAGTTPGDTSTHHDYAAVGVSVDDGIDTEEQEQEEDEEEEAAAAARGSNAAGGDAGRVVLHFHGMDGPVTTPRPFLVIRFVFFQKKTSRTLIGAPSPRQCPPLYVVAEPASPTCADVAIFR